ncbi:MAG: carbohydrate ABC transporter permease [Oscillospiraceae bacterium]|nr:carbohydrate ABC transporter permease [Oscillospiraceae bacterium]
MAKRVLTNTITYVLLGFLVLICIIPFYNMIINATLPNHLIASRINLLPGTMILDNYETMRTFVDMISALRNSVFISVPSTILTAYFGTMAAYGFSKFNFKGKNALFLLVLSTLMIPHQLTLIGLFQIANAVNLIDSYWPIVLPAIANAMTVFWMRAHISSNIDSSFLDAARIDGCGEILIFHTIIIPLSRNGIFTISILNFVGSWNDFMTPLVMLNTQRLFPASVAVAILRGVDGSFQGAVYMGVALTIIPILVTYLFLNSKITGGITAGGVKG